MLSDALEKRKEEWLLRRDGAENSDIDVDIDAVLGGVCGLGDGKVVCLFLRPKVEYGGME